MTLILTYFLTFIIFLAIDYVGLSYVVKPVFTRHIGHLMLENFRVLPAFLFYAFFIAVVIWFVSSPALEQAKPLGWVFFNAALLGAMAYGTYEFSNLALMKDWTWSMVWTDLIWGSMLTGTSASIGVAVIRAAV